jgi:hypothetical protein
MKIATIISQIDLGSIALPQFQRGYVWNRNQVRSLMFSLYRKYPVGSLLVWVTKAENAYVRGDSEVAPGTIKLLLDGQQRMTTLYGIVKGKPPRFFEGNRQSFTDLYFNLDDETFEFYLKQKMETKPEWISVTELMQKGAGQAIAELIGKQTVSDKLKLYANRINSIDQIKELDLHIEEVSGEDKNIDAVVDIFNRVNTGGTKLSSGDLALAKVCAIWPEARSNMRTLLDKWRKACFNFQLEWLLRCINANLTGKAPFSALEKKVDSPLIFQDGLKQAERTIDILLNLVAARLGLDHDRVLGSRYSMPLMTRYLAQRNYDLGNHRERDRLLYWYIHTFLWGRYAGSTESKLARDLTLIESNEGALDRIVTELRTNRPDLRVQPADFAGATVANRFYPLLYMLTRVWKAKDFDSGIELSSHLLGSMSRLEMHHIFPKSMLYKHGYKMGEANAIANFTFLTKETNLKVTNHDPQEYLEQYVKRNPGVVESHWIPMDRNLWKIENYRQFLEERRKLLAKAANDFLDSLIAGAVPETPTTKPITEREVEISPGGIEGEEERKIIIEINEWIIQQGLPEGQEMYELADATTGQPLAIIDLAWPSGLQTELSQPVALMINEDPETVKMASQASYKCFTDIEAFKRYVQREILALSAA